jgi:predicted O-methyltransferase YrrM
MIDPTISNPATGLLRSLRLSADGSGGGSFSSGPSRVEHQVEDLKRLLTESGFMLGGTKTTDSPKGFCSLPEIKGHPDQGETMEAIRETVRSIVAIRDWNRPTRLDVQAPDTAHSKIYAGVDYRDHGPVLVNPAHLKAMFPYFEKPSQEEIAARVAVGKELYGTMPGVESAYTGALIKAMRPRSILVIGEHRGALTDYVARCAPEDCVVVTIDLPNWMHALRGTAQLDAINQIYIQNCTPEQIGSIWRDANAPHSTRIIGFAGDSTHRHSDPLFTALRGLVDVVIVDGNHGYEPTVEDLTSASTVVSEGGVVFVDDFWKPVRLFEVTEAALHIRRTDRQLRDLYHLSWGVGEDAIQSNLAFFIAR